MLIAFDFQRSRCLVGFDCSTSVLKHIENINKYKYIAGTSENHNRSGAFSGIVYRGGVLEIY